ncbi:MAG: tail fiber domain-containing protein [Bdellovibrionales bacterium]
MSDRRGFTLIEILVSIALVAAGIFGVLNVSGIFYNQMKAENQFTILRNRIFEMRQFFSVEAQCNKNFANLSLNPSINKIAADILDSNDVQVLVDNFGNQPGPVQFNGIRLFGFNAFSNVPAPNLTGLAILEMEVEYPPGNIRRDQLPLLVVVAPATFDIISCSGITDQSSLWSNNVNSLFSMAQNVGVGQLPEPPYSLAVNGDFNLIYENNSGPPGWRISPSGNMINIVSNNNEGMSFLNDFYLNYGPLGTGFCTNFAYGALNICDDGVSTLPLMKFETGTLNRAWEFDVTRGLGSVGDQKLNGLRISGQSDVRGIHVRSNFAVGGSAAGMKFYVAGKAGGLTPWMVASDARLKTDVSDLEIGLNELRLLRPVSYIMRQSAETQLGFIAQDIPKEFEPIAGQIGPYKSIRYSEIIPALAKSLQQLSVEVEAQQRDFEQLKSKICKTTPQLKACTKKKDVADEE